MFLDDFVKRAAESIKSYPEAVSYIKGRGLDEEDITKYSLGYVKIARMRDDKSEDYQRLKGSTFDFRGLERKILFPLRNVLGIAHGISIRDIAKKRYQHHYLVEAKALGSFFGLVEALPHIIRTRKVFVHEGAFNAMSFAKILPNTVSSLTSFLNEPQYELLSMLVEKIILVYDKDKAGDFGVEKSLEYYGASVIDHVHIGESDSNDILRTLGLSRFEKYVKSKVPRLFQE